MAVRSATFPVRHVGAFQKTAKSDRLRADQAADSRASRALTALYRMVYARDGYKCVACKRPVVVGAISELKRAHPHHIVPRSLAAKAIKHTTANICTVCPLCHSDIGSKTLFITGNADKHLSIRRVA